MKIGKIKTLIVVGDFTLAIIILTMLAVLHVRLNDFKIYPLEWIFIGPCLLMLGGGLAILRLKEDHYDDFEDVYGLLALMDKNPLEIKTAITRIREPYSNNIIANIKKIIPVREGQLISIRDDEDVYGITENWEISHSTLKINITTREFIQDIIIKEIKKNNK